MIKKIIFLFFGAVLLWSCATVPFIQRESSIKSVVELINTGNHAKLSELSEIPFLLDGEIIVMPGDVSFFWETALKNGLSISGYTIESVGPPDAGDSAVFSESREIAMFFAKYVPEDSSIAKIKASSGTFYLLLNGKEGKYPRIIGFKGDGA